MIIMLTDCNVKLQSQGIDLTKGDNSKLTDQLSTKLNQLQNWGYSFSTDMLIIDTLDNTIPDLSTFGTVMS